MSMICPHCGARALVRSTKRMSKLSREKIYRCQSCPHQFVTVEEIVRSIHASDTPDPTINLPIVKLADRIKPYSR